MTRINLLCFFVLFGITQTFSQLVELSPMSKISLLTIGTGNDLAAKFGHSAIRLQDQVLGIDEVYGYGTYDFEDPNFYLNFVRGKLAYTISRIPFQYFIRGYQQEQRWVKEQELRLNLDQRQALVSFLENNLLPENRKYIYDFLFDNCATRIPDVLQQTLGNQITYDLDYIKKEDTFRDLIHESLQLNTWSSLGIDLALGAVIDKKATVYQYMFLPKYVHSQMEHATINGMPLVTSSTVLLDIPTKSMGINFFLSPAFWLILLSLFILYITYKDLINKKRSVWLDKLILLVTGSIGVLIMFLWFWTDHNATKLNFNILWAFAFNVIVFFILQKLPPKQQYGYYVLLLLLIAITFVLWIFKVQAFHPLLLIVLTSLSIRYLYTAHYTKNTIN